MKLSPNAFLVITTIALAAVCTVWLSLWTTA